MSTKENPLSTDNTVTSGSGNPIEVNRDKRGHDFYPKGEQMARIPKLYATERTPTADKIVWLHPSWAPATGG